MRSLRICSCLCAALLAAAAQQPQALRAGRSAVKITPPKGMPMEGYYDVRLNEGVHDDLYAKAIVIESGGAKAALVACDLVEVPRPLVEAAREAIAKSTGVPPAAVMISGTHTHTGPVLNRNPLGVAPETARIVGGYLDALPGKIAESVRLAEADLQPARVSAGVGEERAVSFVRRYWMRNGTVGWNPGKLNPDILGPTGAIDPSVPVVYFDSNDSKPLATYVNFANHLDTVGGLQFSADYPYTIARILGDVKGSGMLTLFTIGTAGNINHLDVNSREPQQGNGEAARIGAILAGDVLKTYRGLKPLNAGPVQTRSEIIKLPLADISGADLEKARKVAAAFGTPAAGSFYGQVQALKVLDVAARKGRPIEAEVQVVALGDQVAWVGLPGEIFVELGKAIKIASPFPYTIIAELANGSIDYVPDRKAYAEGAYEVISARCGPGSGEALVDAAVRMLIELHASRHEKPAL